MADTKFKVGDRVRLIHTTGISILPEGSIATVSRVDAGKIIGTKEGDAYKGGDWDYRNDWFELATPQLPPKFILQYELDKDQFEFFATEKEARKRIAELAERTDLKRDSIRLIEIKKIRTVKLGVKISISK